MLESQFRYILGAVRRIAATGALDVRPEVQQRFADRVQDRVMRTRRFDPSKYAAPA